MKIAILKERRPHERRVAATPDTVKKLIGLGFEVVVETAAGLESRILDQAYVDAGARIAGDAAEAADNAQLVLKVQRPLIAGEGEIDELALLQPGALLLGMLAPYADRAAVEAYARRKSRLYT